MKTEKKTIYIVGIGPGCEDMMTVHALSTLEKCDVIIGYSTYIKLIEDKFKDKELLATPMTTEEKRCRMAYECVLKGKTVSLICSGDSGIYGLASLMYELLPEYKECELTVIPGVTAAISGASLLGAPINNDFCVISLSDYMTPWEQIENRIIAAIDGDFVIVLYNPASSKRPDYLKKACDIMLKKIEDSRACGLVENIGREGMKVEICSLSELKDKNVNMYTTVYIGSSQTIADNGKLITKRGYKL